MSSTLLYRWLIPLALVVAAILLSAFVFYAKLPVGARVYSPTNFVAFLATPGVALLVLLTLRGATRASPTVDRSADLVVVWVVTFLFGIHAAVLATMIGMVGSMRAVVPSAVALLLLGLGPAIGTLGHRSPLGIRTSGTLVDRGLWRRTHRLAGVLLALAGVSGLVGAQLGGPWALVMGIGPAVIALIIALGYGSQSPNAIRSEHSAANDRPSDEATGDRSDLDR